LEAGTDKGHATKVEDDMIDMEVSLLAGKESSSRRKWKLAHHAYLVPFSQKFSRFPSIFSFRATVFIAEGRRKAQIGPESTRI
jgi:hypothetical protein